MNTFEKQIIDHPELIGSIYNNTLRTGILSNSNMMFAALDCVVNNSDKPSYEASFSQLQGKSLVEKRPLKPRDVTTIFSDE